MDASMDGVQRSPEQSDAPIDGRQATLSLSSSVSAPAPLASAGVPYPLHGNVMPAISDGSEFHAHGQLPPVRLSEVAITVHSRAKPGGDDFAIDEPFAVSAWRIQETLGQHLTEIGDRIQLSSDGPRAAGLLARLGSGVASTKLLGGTLEAESFDVVRPQVGGGVLRLYTVTISKARAPGTIQIDLDRDESAGLEGLTAAQHARRIIKPDVEETGAVATQPKDNSFSEPVISAPEKPQHEGFAAAVAELRADQKRLLDENAAVSQRLADLGLLPPGEPLLVSQDLTDYLERLESFGEQVKKDLLTLVGELERGECELAPKSGQSPILRDFSYTIQGLDGYQKLGRDYYQMKENQETRSRDFGAYLGVGLFLGLPVWSTAPFVILSECYGVMGREMAGLLGLAVWVVGTVACTVAIPDMLESRAFYKKMHKYDKKLRNALFRMFRGREAGSFGEILGRLEKAGVSSKFEVQTPSPDEYEKRGSLDCKVKLSIFCRREKAK